MGPCECCIRVQLDSKNLQKIGFGSLRYTDDFVETSESAQTGLVRTEYPMSGIVDTYVQTAAFQFPLARSGKQAGCLSDRILLMI